MALSRRPWTETNYTLTGCDWREATTKRKYKIENMKTQMPKLLSKIRVSLLASFRI